MKNLSKIAILISFLFVSTTVSSQILPVNLGVRTGLNLSNMNGDYEGNILPGFTIGLTVDYGIAHNLYLMSGLDFSNEGTKDGKFKARTSYLKLPAHIGYKLPVIEDKVNIVFHGGPHFALGLSSRYQLGAFSANVYDGEFEDIFGFKHRRFDVGLGFGVGAEINGFVFNIGCDFGLINQFKAKKNFKPDLIDIPGLGDIEIDLYDGVATRNMNISFTIGYKL